MAAGGQLCSISAEVTEGTCQLHITELSTGHGLCYHSLPEATLPAPWVGHLITCGVQMHAMRCHHALVSNPVLYTVYTN